MSDISVFGGPIPSGRKKYCCCVKSIKVTAKGSRDRKDGEGRFAGVTKTNTIKVEVDIEMRESDLEQDSLCAIEWFEAGDPGAAGWMPSKKHGGQKWAKDGWNAAHERHPDGLKDKKSFERNQRDYLESYLESIEPDPIEPAPNSVLLGADDEPFGSVNRLLNVLIIAKSGCPGCVSCCAWLRYTYSAKSIDVDVIGAECSGRCDNIASDFKDFKPFDKTLDVPKEGALSRGEKGGSFTIAPK